MAGMNIEQYFQQPKFQRLRRLIVSVEGIQKVGKTTLALTSAMLGPVAILDYDFGLQDMAVSAREVFPDIDLSRVWHLPLGAPTSMLLAQDVTQEEYKEAWKKATGAYYSALADPRIVTIVIDTGTEFWEACRLSHFNKLEKVWPMTSYAAPNGEMRKILRDAVESTKNLILIHRYKDEYVNDNRTGNQVFAGFKEIPGLVQMVVKLWKSKGQYGLTITDCRQKRVLEGTELPPAIATFPQLLNLVHGPEEEDE